MYINRYMHTGLTNTQTDARARNLINATTRLFFFVATTDFAFSRFEERTHTHHVRRKAKRQRTRRTSLPLSSPISHTYTHTGRHTI